jgi:hypothetical protein
MKEHRNIVAEGGEFHERTGQVHSRLEEERLHEISYYGQQGQVN